MERWTVPLRVQPAARRQRVMAIPKVATAQLRMRVMVMVMVMVRQAEMGTAMGCRRPAMETAMTRVTVMATRGTETVMGTAKRAMATATAMETAMATVTPRRPAA